MTVQPGPDLQVGVVHDHRIREAMKLGAAGLMGASGGVIEADETYWGNNSKQRKGARGYGHKKLFRWSNAMARSAALLSLL
ncbi:MAG: hypothetical protein ACYCZD_11135 [Rhodanobacter sp.]